ncbi:sensor histidine kinase [Curtanaerobium respiraculi]|uniref:sensor histidine kinase n=1 Tax=Curtanaerobium respiraculi TaxID=2949669 RepID=UPI0024B3767C|nr:hypothetical protein [Curtanaerobium respiraculi]
MPDWKRLFQRLSDTVIVTDAYGYILDFNRKGPFPSMRKGANIERYVPEGIVAGELTCTVGGRAFRRQVSPVAEGGRCVGYVVIFEDITEKKRLCELNAEKNRQLDEAAQEQEKAIAQLREYTHQIEAFADQEERHRVACRIHDEAGHAITDLFTRSQICLLLKDTDPEYYARLLDEGVAICNHALAIGEGEDAQSLGELLRPFADEALIPVHVTIAGDEPGWAAPLRGIIHDICDECYHNVLAHSMADEMAVRLDVDEADLTLIIEDNGRFRGEFRKGFGLSFMEERVRNAGGSVDFCAVPGQGFKVTVVFGEVGADEHIED